MDGDHKLPAPKLVYSQGSQSQQAGGGLNRELVAGRVAALLAHYWTDPMPENLQAMLASDWLDDLVEFPAPIVAEACQSWRRTERRKPMPSDIRSRCLELQREAAEQNRPRIEYLPAEQTGVRTVLAQRFAEASAARDEWAQSLGCRDFAEASKIGLQHIAKRRRA